MTFLLFLIFLIFVFTMLPAMLVELCLWYFFLKKYLHLPTPVMPLVLWSGAFRFVIFLIYLGFTESLLQNIFSLELAFFSFVHVVSALLIALKIIKQFPKQTPLVISLGAIIIGVISGFVFVKTLNQHVPLCLQYGGC